jgi:uncharacterized protein YcfJ
MMMKSLVLTLAILGYSASMHANASSTIPTYVTGVITEVEPIYKKRNVSIPISVCDDVQVPIYGPATNPSAVDRLTAGVVGGALGSTITGGASEVVVTALGAILGAGFIANTNPNGPQKIVAYQTNRTCATQMDTRVEQVLTHYIVMVKANDQVSTFNTTKKYIVGDAVKIELSQSLK